ncbi:MAG: hypothetical protein K5872_15790 [Rhizobiaceae bacterium]|nr:hypothetical protein [Rhizobiaceae bacterium]MCV0407685.1 hypothetical protein [Rhizobiaceae bacterium]
MITHLAGGWLLMVIATIAILSFLLGLIVDAIAEEDAFGPIGNSMVIMAGFHLGVFSAREYSSLFDRIEAAAIAGLFGALIALCTLSLMKAGLQRAL